MRKKSGFEIAEENRDLLINWEKEGKTYFWMAKNIGIGERNFSIISKWFIKQNIFKRRLK